MKKTNKILVVALVIVMAFAAMACGNSGKYKTQTPDGKTVSYNTIEELFAIPAVKESYDQMTEQIISSYKDVYSKYDTKFVGDTITYSYYYVDGVDADAIKENLEKEEWSSNIVGVKDSIENDTQIRPEKITYEYYTVDGELIFSVGE